MSKVVVNFAELLIKLESENKRKISV